MAYRYGLYIYIYVSIYGLYSRCVYMKTIYMGTSIQNDLNKYMSHVSRASQFNATSVFNDAML